LRVIGSYLRERESDQRPAAPRSRRTLRTVRREKETNPQRTTNTQRTTYRQTNYHLRLHSSTHARAFWVWGWAFNMAFKHSSRLCARFRSSEQSTCIQALSHSVLESTNSWQTNLLGFRSIRKNACNRHRVDKQLADEPFLLHVHKVGRLGRDVAGVVHTRVSLPRRLAVNAVPVFLHLEDGDAPRLIALLRAARRRRLEQRDVLVVPCARDQRVRLCRIALDGLCEVVREVGEFDCRLRGSS